MKSKRKIFQDPPSVSSSPQKEAGSESEDTGYDSEGNEVVSLKKGRVWSPEDELTLLQGVLDFEKAKGVKFTEDGSGFFTFIRSSLFCEVRPRQVRDKLSKLKTKFRNSKVNNLHDANCFDLWKKIWGRDTNVAECSGVKSKAKKKKSRSIEKKSRPTDSVLVLDKEREDVPDSSHFMFFNCLGAAAGMEESVKKSFDMLHGENKANLKERWSEYRNNQLELSVTFFDLVKEQTRLVLEEFKSSSSSS